MSSAPKLSILESTDYDLARQSVVDRYLAELRIYLAGIVPSEDIERFLEETADHLEFLLEERLEVEVVPEFGTSREVADQFIEAWYTKRSRLTPLEKFFGPGNLSVVALFGFAAVLYWALLQFRVFLPSNSAYHLPWSPGEIRRYFPEPLPFPDFSLQFLLMTGVPLLAPPIAGWIVGRIVPVRPQTAVYSVLMPMILISYIIGILLLPVTDGLIFAVVQSVYWLPVGCAFASLSSSLARKARLREVRRL